MSTITKPHAPHILLFPFPSSGHVIPILDLADQLLRRNLTVTVLVTTAKNLGLLSPLLSSYPHSLHSLLLSPDESHFKPNAVPSQKRLITIIRSLSDLRTPILNWFKSHPSPPVAIVSDFFLGWTRDLATEIGITRVNFSPYGAFATAVSDYLWQNMPERNDDSDDYALIEFNGVPNSAVFPWWHLSHVYRNYQKGDPDWEFFKNVMLANITSWGIVFNSSTELERDYIDYIKHEKGDDRVWAVGPLLPSADGNSAGVVEKRGGSSSVSSDLVLNWLDQRSDRSVVYICFGSRVVLNHEQMEALTAGLEFSGVHFVLCVRDAVGEVLEDEGVIPEGYEDRVADRGVVIKGWAPQVTILKHKAVGAFLSHCGWNSVLEGLSAGMVMLTWPDGADQFANAMLLVDQLGVGIRLGEGTKKVPNPNKLAQIVAESLDETRPERARALELKEATSRAVKGGSSEIALNDLVKKLTGLNDRKV